MQNPFPTRRTAGLQPAAAHGIVFGSGVAFIAPHGHVAHAGNMHDGNTQSARFGDQALDMVQRFPAGHAAATGPGAHSSEELTPELQSLMRISYSVLFLKTNTNVTLSAEMHP